MLNIPAVLEIYRHHAGRSLPNLYTLQYAEFAGLHLIVGSHTFTEIFGVRSLARKLQEAYGELELVEVHEAHME